MGRRVSVFSWGIAILCALVCTTGVANAGCSTLSNTVTCTSGAGASITLTTSNNQTHAGTPFPTTINVSGGSGTLQSMNLTLHGYTSDISTGEASRDMGLLLVSPSGRNMEVLRCPGNGGTAQSNITVKIQDGGTTVPSCRNADIGIAGPWTAGGTYAPAAYLDPAGVVNYAQAGAPALTAGHTPSNQGTATLNSVNGVFTGDTVNGNWSLYLVDNTPDNATVSFSSWDIAITFTAASTPSTTTLTPNPTTAYTTATGNSVVLGAQVTATATGTVSFQEGATVLTCSEGIQPRPLNGSAHAVCTTTFSAEGYHSLSASYSGDGTFVASTGSSAVFTQNHSTNIGHGTVYCNTGAILGDGQSNSGFTHVNPYPSVIFIGDGVNDNIAGSVNTLSVQLKTFAAVSNTTDMHMLLVAPDGTHAFDFWGNAGSTLSGGNYTLIDGSAQLPTLGAISPGSYGPTTYFNTDLFTPAPPAPAPQAPGSFSLAAPAGSDLFQTAFVGTAAHGAWSLFLYNGSGGGVTTDLNGGWCLNISPGTGHATTVNVTSNPSPKATTGASVTFTATVTSTQTVNIGTVTFTENGAPLTGAPNGGAANVNSSGVASTSTTLLPEGDHTIKALYHDSTNTFNDNFGTVSMREDASTATPTLNGSTWSYCNPTGIVIPLGTVAVNDIGAAAPNPSNIFVTNLPGTINSVGLTLKSFHVTSPGNLDSLLVGPNGLSAPTLGQTLDFFSGAGGNGGSTNFTHDTSFLDGFGPVSCLAAGPAPGLSNAPTSCIAVSPSYFPSPFYTLPGTFQRAATGGAFTFDTGTYIPNTSGGVYTNTLPNGTWSLYFNQNIHHAGIPADGASSWCVNFVENPVTVGATAGHTGSAPSNHFKQGEQNAQIKISIHNNGDSNGKGSTGDPDGLHPLTVVDVLPANLDYTPGTLPTGTPWNCTNAGQTVTCKSSSAIAAGSDYPQLLIPVNVANGAGASDNNSFTASGGGVTSTTSNTDTITIDPAPVLAVTKSHSGTFTQGSTATWNIQVTNNAVSATGATDGSTVTVSDTLPTGYTLNSFSGPIWSCSGSNVITCTTNAVVAGANTNFGFLTLTVNVPTSSPTSVNNTAKVFGGGDVAHTNLATAAMGSDSVTVVQVPATITPSASTTPQSTGVGTAFGTNLGVLVKDAGGVAIPSFTVTLAAPGAGASGTFATIVNPPCGGANCQLTTDVSGVATAPTFTANGTPGSYNVQATAGPVSTNFALTNLPQITVNTSVSGPTVQVDGGVAFTGSQNFFWAPTTTHSLATSTPQTVGSTQYAFVNWSDGGAVTHNVSGPAVNTTYTATFDAVPTVTSFSVLFGSQSFTLGSVARTRLPWQITGIQVVFSKAMTGGNMNSLGGVTPTGLSGLGTNTLTWTISPISIGAFTATLAGSGGNALTDAAGIGLGNGAGASQAFKVLWGDYNDDGVVNSQDLLLVNRARSQAYNIFADMNGDGIVDGNDVNIVRSQIGTFQP